jgi:hypothetical protein
MSGMVDSKQKQLNSAEIIMTALENTRSKHPPQIAFTAIMAEFGQPNTDVKIMGNTLFVLHKADNHQAFFKALNADVARNFVESSRAYVVYAKKELGMKMLVTEFEDPAISTLFHAISKKPPMPGMGFKEYKTSTGMNRIVLNLG